MDEPWTSLLAWIRSRHVVVAETGSEIGFMFDVGGWPRQLVVRRATCGDGTWIVIASPVVRAARDFLDAALQLTSRCVVGALAVVDQRLVVRHVEPIGRVTTAVLELLCREVALVAGQVDALVRDAAAAAAATTGAAAAGRPVFQHFAD